MDDASIKRRTALLQFEGVPPVEMLKLAKELFPDAVVRPAILIILQNGKVISVEAVDREPNSRC